MKKKLLLGKNNFGTILAIMAVALGVFATGALPRQSRAMSAPINTAPAVASATAYLQSKPLNPWSIMALAAAGSPASTSSVASALAASASTSTAIGLEAPILAMTAMGEDPRQAADGENWVSDLGNFYDGTQIGDTSTLNDDIFGLLALTSAGVSSTDPVVSGTRAFLLNNQNASDGGWAYNTGGTSDTNTTAAAIMALLASGSQASDTAMVHAAAYLKSAQNTDGGFTYDPTSQWGTSTDASSDSWIISAITALAESPTSSAWSTPSSTNAVDSLLSMQEASSGLFQYQPGSGQDSFSPITTSYALLALLGKFLPVGIIAPTATIATTTPSAPTSAPAAATTTISYGGGGASTVQVSYRIEGPSGDLCGGDGSAVTAIDILADASSFCGITYHVQQYNSEAYVDRIDTFSAAGANGWLYLVDGVKPSVGAGDYKLKASDVVIWYFGSGNGPTPATNSSPSGTSASGGSTSTNATTSTTITATTTLQFATSTNAISTSTLIGQVLGASTTTVVGTSIDTGSTSASGSLQTLEQTLMTLEFRANNCTFQFNKNLRRGMDNSDVKNLQTVLDYVPTFVAGGIGGAALPTTGYFGNATEAAVIAFQDMWNDKILAPNGMTTGNGFVGAATRAVLNNLCTQSSNGKN
jgi:hypothetical protein